MTNHPAELLKYHAWANQTIIGRIKELPAPALSQEVNSSFPTVAHALSHIYVVDRMWYLVLTGAGMPEAFQATMALNTRILGSIDEYAVMFEELAGQYGDWIQSQDDLEQTILLDNPFAGVRQTRLSEIVLHVVNHGTYHRGNVSTMLRQLGHASAMNDYALFWYQAAASPTA
ncbi:DinB family protein [Paenibacillus soyae]|uniref:DinB family protein n=1 Tax=Paenibacillus soyae TaxID=2969249 RepID=A0A9X2S9B6_9BACL|nr:DinB family protein [Paenibacillus soyae]MCR2803363.1 DinB family protein [Paenibacillus soyae]